MGKLRYVIEARTKGLPEAVEPTAPAATYSIL